MVYLDIHTSDSVPGETLSHPLTAAAIESESSPETVTGARTVIRSDPPPILGAPLRGGPWSEPDGSGTVEKAMPGPNIVITFEE